MGGFALHELVDVPERVDGRDPGYVLGLLSEVLGQGQGLRDVQVTRPD